MYYILVCLSKVFQRTIFSFVLPFQRESVCKGKAFFRNLQIFSKVFLKKIFGRFSEGVRLILSRSLAYPQGKILGAAIGTISRSLSSASLSSSAALPLESGCKGTDFFRFRNFYCILFCRIFSGFLPNSLIYFMLYSIFFIVVRKRMWNDLHYIIRASACVCARKHRRIMTDGKHLIRPGRSARSLQKKRKDIWFKTQVRFTSNARTF